MTTPARWKGKARAVEYDLPFRYSRDSSVDTHTNENGYTPRGDGDYGRQRPRRRASGSGFEQRDVLWTSGRRDGGRRDGSGSGEHAGSSDIGRRDGVVVEGDGEAGGVVLPLDMVGSGVYDVAYTLPVKFGSTDNGRTQQQFSLQIDTGSSDLWIASTSCSTSSCKLTDGRLYDPSQSQARATGVDFSIPYLSGSASGPVYWDSVTIGGYTIDNQALAAASNVDSEPLSSKFSGILGLALPLNSIIAASIPPVTSNAPDGAAWASNLFSITPTSDAPAARFLSLSLARPGSDRVPSVLGIGRHPSALVPDPSKVQYATLVAEATGTLFWKVGVRAITVYVDGVRKDVDVGRGSDGGVFPSAVVDSGVPLILATSAIANAVYGAIGVEPASDGKYYMPCTTPLNLTFTLDTRSEIPIHPLDLTALPDSDSSSSSYSPSSSTCVGLIQSADAFLGSGASSSGSSIGDMILGVPFLRNTYTVMAYTAPAKDGSFPSVNSTAGGGAGDVRPRLGLLALTDPTTALQEFHTVRVLNQPLSSSSSTSNSTTPGTGNTGSDNNTKTVSSAHKLSTGAIVGLSILAVFVLSVLIVGARYILSKRSRAMWRREREKELAELGMRGSLALGTGTGKGGFGFGEGDDGYGLTMDQKAAYDIVRGRGRGRGLGVDGTGVGEVGAGVVVGEDGVLLGLRERESERTLLGREGVDGKEKQGVLGTEFGKMHGEGEGEGDDTLVVRRVSKAGDSDDGHGDHTRVEDADAHSPPSSPEIPSFTANLPLLHGQEHEPHTHAHHRHYADSESIPPASSTRDNEHPHAHAHHKQLASVDVPLLAHAHHSQGSQGSLGSSSSEDDAPRDRDRDRDAESTRTGRSGRSAKGAVNYSMPYRMREGDA